MTAVLGRLFDEPTLFLVALALGVLALLIAMVGVVRSRGQGSQAGPAPEPPKPLPTVEREPLPVRPRRPRPRLTASGESLDDLYVEGRRMQQAAQPFAGVLGGIYSRTPPSEAEIDRWQGRIRASLPPAHRRRFRFAPLEARVNEPLVKVPGLLVESKQAKRLRESMGELKRIMDELDTP